MKKVGVIGGGIAGCATALEAARQGYDVSLFESTDQLLGQSSDASSCCFGVGFYHSDIDAAKTSLESCIRLIRYLKEQTGNTFQVQDYTKGPARDTTRIVYVVGDNSVIPPVEVLAMYESLKCHYAHLISQDSENAVLGEVERFYRVLDIQQFVGILDIEKAAIIIDTCDTMFDWVALKKHLIHCLYSHENITIYLKSNVKALQHPILESDSLKTKVITEDGPQYLFDEVINAAWRNADRLNQAAGFYHGEPIINKILALAVVKLPKELQNRSFLFGYRKLLFLTSGSDGVGYLSYAPASYRSVFPSDASQLEEDRFMLEMSDATSKKKLGEEIIAGASQHIPALANCTLLDLKIGVIRAPEQVVNKGVCEEELKLKYKGIRAVALGLIINEARQHTFWNENAQEVLLLLNKHAKTKSMVIHLARLIVEHLPEKLHKPTILLIFLSHFSSLFVNIEPAKLETTFQTELSRFSLFFLHKHYVNDQISKLSITPA